MPKLAAHAHLSGRSFTTDVGDASTIPSSCRGSPALPSCPCCPTGVPDPRSGQATASLRHPGQLPSARGRGLPAPVRSTTPVPGGRGTCTRGEPEQGCHHPVLQTRKQRLRAAPGVTRSGVGSRGELECATPKPVSRLCLPAPCRPQVGGAGCTALPPPDQKPREGKSPVCHGSAVLPPPGVSTAQGYGRGSKLGAA